MFNILKGKLTYTMAGLAIAWGVIGFLAGWSDGETSMAAIWAGLAVFGIRRAM